MVTKTEKPVSDSSPAASEDKPPASEPAQLEKPVEESQEQAAAAEGKTLEQLRAELAGEIAEAKRRAEQSGYGQGQERWKAKQKEDEEQTALVKDHDQATTALRKAASGENVDADEVIRLAQRMAQAGAVAEHIPHLRREYRDAREELPLAEQWTEAELAAFNERGATGKREGVNVLRAVWDVATRLAADPARADGAKAEKERMDTYLRGEPPPSLGGLGALTPKELTYVQLADVYGRGVATADQNAEYLRQRAERRR
jgi:hypothetical protein